MPATKYQLNKVCAHPECDRTDVTAHHIYPKGNLNSGAWFLLIDQTDAPPSERIPIPHVVGLCGSGTTGHHGDVEEHRAWIKLEDGEFTWWNRIAIDGHEYENFLRLGALNPQPGLREGKPKRKKFKGEARRQRKTISIRVPQDEQEDGAGIFEDYVEQCKDRLYKEGLDIDRPIYYLLCDIMVGYLQSA